MCRIWQEVWWLHRAHLSPVSLQWRRWGPSTVPVEHPQPFTLHLHNCQPLSCRGHTRCVKTGLHRIWNRVKAMLADIIQILTKGHRHWDIFIYYTELSSRAMWSRAWALELGCVDSESGSAPQYLPSRFQDGGNNGACASWSDCEDETK